MNKVNYGALRAALYAYLEDAYNANWPYAVNVYSLIQNSTDEELIDIAKEVEGFDYSKYIKPLSISKITATRTSKQISEGKGNKR